MVDKYRIYNYINRTLFKITLSFFILLISIQLFNSAKEIHINSSNTTLMTTNLDLKIIDIIPKYGEIELIISNTKTIKDIEIYLNSKKMDIHDNTFIIKVSNGDLLEFICKRKDIVIKIKDLQGSVENIGEEEIYELNIGYNRPISIKLKDY